MREFSWQQVILCSAMAVSAIGEPIRAAQAPNEPNEDPPRYEYRKNHDRDGIGKFYMGREIARVMGHQGAEWLERPVREQEEAPSKLLDSLDIRPGAVVADIGAGSGYMTFRLAKRIGPKGKVLAVDIQPKMLSIIRKRMREREVRNIKLIQGKISDPRLPAAAVDLILLVDVYHEFSHPYEMTTAMIRSLKPKGRIVFVEYRSEDPSVPIKRLHKMSEKQVLEEMSIHPLRWVGTVDVLPRQHIILFEKQSAVSDQRPAASRQRIDR